MTRAPRGWQYAAWIGPGQPSTMFVVASDRRAPRLCLSSTDGRKKKGRRGIVPATSMFDRFGTHLSNSKRHRAVWARLSYRSAILSAEVNLTETKRSPLNALESLISRLGSRRSVGFGSGIITTMATMATIAMATATEETSATVATIAMATIAAATTMTGPTTTFAVVSSLAIATVTRGVTAMTAVAAMSGIGFAFAAKQGDSNHREEGRDAKHQCSIHPRILQSTSTVASGISNHMPPPLSIHSHSSDGDRGGWCCPELHSEGESLSVADVDVSLCGLRSVRRISLFGLLKLTRTTRLSSSNSTEYDY